MEKLDLKRTSILDSATKVFSEKGFTESTISEIAKSAKIGDSAVYDYFKGKEEILFAIPEENMTVFLFNLEDQLEGIKGAENKLRKLIWHHCKFFATHKEYTHVLLLVCRSNPRFYNSEAYRLIKDYSNIIINIVEEGIREGKICGLSSPRVLRDMIMGTIDHVALNWIMKSTPNPLTQAEEIYEMIINPVKPRASERISLHPKVKKRKQIINAATKILSNKGYNKATISEIAKEAGVADGTIYEYFGSKENLLISIPEEKLGEFLIDINEVSPEKKLKKMILEYFRFFNANRDYTSILVLMLRPNRKFYNSTSYQVIDKISNIFQDIIVEGQQKGIFLQNFNIDIFQNLIFGTIDHITIPWVIFKRKYDLLQVGEEASELLTKAITV